MKYDTLEVQNVKLGDHLIVVYMWDKMKKCRWACVVVYGPAHEELKAGFLAELSGV